MRRMLPLLLIITLLLPSCEMEKKEGKVVFISAAIDYGAPDGINALDNPPEDQRVLSAQLEALAIASGEIYEEYLFLEKNGQRSVNGKEYGWNHDDILAAISSLDTVRDDLIIFHYSGHGDEDGSLVTDMDTAFRLSPERILDALEGTDGMKCLFLDSCYSGNFIEEQGWMHDGELFDDKNLVSESFINSLLPSLMMTLNAAKREESSIWVLSAATAKQSSFDSWDAGHPGQENFGAFTYYLASALGYDAENDTPTVPGRGGEITFYGLYQEIRKNMSSDLWKRATPQVTLTPFDLILFRF